MPAVDGDMTKPVRILTMRKFAGGKSMSRQNVQRFGDKDMRKDKN
jgi:hypothetical protein